VVVRGSFPTSSVFNVEGVLRGEYPIVSWSYSQTYHLEFDTATIFQAMAFGKIKGMIMG